MPKIAFENIESDSGIIKASPLNGRRRFRIVAVSFLLTYNIPTPR